MIHVQMRKHNALYITRADTEIPQLRPNLLFTLNPKGDFPSQVRMEGLACLEKMRSLTSIDYNDAVAMLDDPRIGGKPVSPIAICENGQPSRQSVSAPFDLRGLDPDEAGLNGIYLHTGTQSRAGPYPWPELST